MLINFLKDRTWKIPVVRFLFIILFVSASWYFCGKLEFSGRKVAEAYEETDGPIVSIEEPGDLLTYIVKPGDTFAGILAGFGFRGNDIAGYYQSLVDVGLSAIYPGDSCVLETDGKEKLKAISLLSRLRCWYHLQFDSLSLMAEKRPCNSSHHRCVVKGYLRSSLSEDMYSLGVGDALVIKFADIFAWDINFFLDPRKGDRFEVLFEKIFREGRFVEYGDILAARYQTRDRVFCAIAMKDSSGRINYYDNNGKSVQKQFLKAPLRYSRISSGYTYRRKHPILGIVRPHLGVDYAAPIGTPVYSAADGKVTFSGRKGDYGNCVRICHGASFETFYGHLNRIARGISSGAYVDQGQLIGTVGKTGLATGPHLDYRMRKGGRFVDPVHIILPSKSGLGKEDMAAFGAIKQTYFSILDKRFDTDGYFLVDIIEPDQEKPVILQKKIAHGKTDDNPQSS